MRRHLDDLEALKIVDLTATRPACWQVSAEIRRVWLKAEAACSCSVAGRTPAARPRVCLTGSAKPRVGGRRFLRVLRVLNLGVS